jgi:hypothetical protein
VAFRGVDPGLGGLSLARGPAGPARRAPGFPASSGPADRRQRDRLGAALVGSGGEFSDEIAIAPNRIGDSNDLFAAVLNELDALSIPVAEDARFETILPSFFGSDSVGVKIDFGDFDYDGSGGAEGCSGHTAELPICMRLWVDGERFLAAVFYDFPTDSNPGAGRFKILLPESSGGDAGVRFAFDYDHSDPLNKRTESLLFTPGSSFAKTFRRAQISQEGPEGAAKKSINYSDQFFFNSLFPDSVRYVGSFLQDSDPSQVFWSGSLELSDNLETPALSEISGVCAQAATGNGVLVGTCQDLGIDTTGIDFIDFAVEEDFEFFDFPNSPTF